jgi:hypothetical protein
MNLGKIKFLIYLIILIFTQLQSKIIAEDKIITSPLINLENLEPTYENDATDKIEDEALEKIVLKEKNRKLSESKNIKVNIIGLDKITAKTSKISMYLGETKKFGLLEIKALQCGKVKSVVEPGSAAYLQVKDLTDNQNEKLFVFNGWTFSSSPTLRSIDHPVYDLWLLSCDNV